MALELLALAVLVAALWSRPTLTARETAGLGLLLLIPLVYLIPLPLGLAEALPGREAYVAVWRTALGESAVPGLTPATLIPRDTFSAWLSLVVPIGVFVGVRSIAPASLPILAYLLLGIACLQSVLGLMQFGGGAESPLYLNMEYTHFGSAVGTYTNRNHLAGLIEMALPLSIALLFYTAGKGRGGGRGARNRAAFLGSVRGQEAVRYGVALVLLLVAVAFTRSRTGIALAILGILLSVALYSRRIGGDNAFGPIGSLVAIALGLTLAIGLVPILDRFSAENVVDNERWTIFSSTLTGIGTFFPLGAGPGTFQEVYPSFQPLEIGHWFINRAHNDYLEWVFEGGVLAVAVIAALLALYALQWGRVWSSGEWSRLRFVQAGAGLGMLLILLHELVDYNLHIPANQVFFAVLAGIFFSDATAVESAAERRKPRRTRRMGEEPTGEAYVPVVPSKPAPDQIRNPFLDD
jgi:O-antigen ligase